MGDYTLPPRNTLVVGMTGSGKTSFAIRYALNAPATCRFIFDDLGRMAPRLKLRPARTLREVETALPTRWVIYNPHTMFPGNPRGGFLWFCEWVYEASKRGPGHKIFVVDEAWQWQTSYTVPPELNMIATTGREEGIELVSCTQYPHRLNGSLTDSATEFVCFKLQDGSPSLAKVPDLGLEARAVSQLPLGSFIALNRMSGGTLAGKLF